jgi:hypothetical protein
MSQAALVNLRKSIEHWLNEPKEFCDAIGKSISGQSYKTCNHIRITVFWQKSAKTILL